VNEWIGDLSGQIAEARACVLVTVAGIRGSAPRELGAKMLVTDRETIGTIGGGQLEYKCTEIACNTIQKKEDGTRLRKFTLGANLGQCCGGVVEVLFESFCAEKPLWLDELQKAHRARVPVVTVTGTHNKYLITSEGECRYPREASIDPVLSAEALRILSEGERAQNVTLNGDDYLLEPVTSSAVKIAVFGAGHVGAATVNTLSSLDCDLRWVDSRRNIFPDRLPDNVQAIESSEPALEVAAMPPGSCYLVMTHSHPLDLEIIQQILKRNDFSYCGLIGSVSKRRRFEKSLRKLGIEESRLNKMTCPIGVAGIDGKKPAEIAIAVAAELLQIVQRKSEASDRELPDNVRVLGK